MRFLSLVVPLRTLVIRLFVQERMVEWVLALEQSKTAQDLVIKKLQKKVKSLEKKQRAKTLGMNLFKNGIFKRQSLDKENVSKHGRNLKTSPMFKEGDIDDDFDDINDMVDEAIENVEGDTVNAGGVVNTTTTRVSATSASVTTVSVSISTAEPRTPPTTTITAFEDEDLTIAQTLIKMRSKKAKEKGVAFRDVKDSRKKDDSKDEPKKEELRLWLMIVQDQDRVINYETLAVKSSIIDWETQLLVSDLQEEDLSYWKITRANGSFGFYKVFSTMLEEFNRQDLLDLHRLVIKRFESVAPEGYDLILWADLKTMIEPNKEDEVWRNQQNWINTTTTRVSATSASVTTVSVSISTAEPRTPPTTTITAFEDEDLTIAQTLIKMRSKKDKEKGVAFRDVKDSGKKDDSSSKLVGRKEQTQLLVSDLQEEDLSYWKITRANGCFGFYKVFSTILEEFNRQDLLDLHRLVIKRFKSVAPEGYDLILWADLKTMIEPNEEDEVWRNQQNWSVIS
nr:hypothetical protein [Tanacetum cinerariifolium]